MSLECFYDSDTYRLISEGIADMHCRSDEYLADELLLELKEAKADYSEEMTGKCLVKD